MDLVVINGQVETLDTGGTVVESVLVRDGKIAALGDNYEVLRERRKGTTVVDAKGKVVLPGFIEPHNHMVGFGTSLLEVDVRTPPNFNINDIKQRLRQKAATTPKGEWVRGRGYDDTGIAEIRHPNRKDLDEVSTEHPMMISHVSGHMLAANSMALELANVNAETPDPHGGRIGRFYGTAEPDGMLYEMPAQILVNRLLPPYDEKDVRKGFLEAQEEYLRQGVTTIHDTGVGKWGGVDILKTYQQAYRDGVLKFRVNMFLIYQLLKDLDFSLLTGFGDEWVRVAGCKIISDGSIQGLTAALREPYHCNEDEKGWLIYEQEELNEMVLTLHRQGYQIATHANGDAAIDAILGAYGNALQILPKANHRFRIEHCQLCRPEHITRMRQLGVIPNFFANHVYYWGDRHRDRFLGPERVQHISPVGSAIKAGMRPMLHSDCPVTPVSPLVCIQSAAARITSSGQLLNGSERISVREATATMTKNAAFGAFEENVKGTLEVGKLGDLVILKQDLFKEKPEEISQIEVAATIVGGQVMYDTTDVSIG